MTDEIMKIAEEFQKECLNAVEETLLKKKVFHQDATNIWFYLKLAEFELRLRKVENK